MILFLFAIQIHNNNRIILSTELNEYTCSQLHNIYIYIAMHFLWSPLFRTAPERRAEEKKFFKEIIMIIKV